MSDDQDDFDLNDLDDKELVEQIQDDLYDGLDEEVAEGVEILLERKMDANDVLGDALVGGMKIVGEDFRDGILFVPEVLKCAAAMKSGMGLLRPILAASSVDISMGKFVIGTVKGDIHDIGKNLVGMMLEGAGFEVIDLGINNPVENYLEALDEHKPVIMGMSALLTTTMPYMGVVIEEMDKRDMMKDFHVMVGGAPLNQEFADAIGAPAYGRDAARSSEMASAYVEGLRQ
ncbi:MAG: corrinoid protein [Pseudomonadota bacterium]